MLKQKLPSSSSQQIYGYRLGAGHKENSEDMGLLKLTPFSEGTLICHQDSLRLLAFGNEKSTNKTVVDVIIVF